MIHNRREHATSTEKRFGARVRRVREAKGLTQSHVAIEMSMLYGHKWDQPIVANTEAAKRTIRLNEAAALAEILETPLAELLGDDTEGDAPTSTAGAVMELRLMADHVQGRLNKLTGSADER